MIFRNQANPECPPNADARRCVPNPNKSHCHSIWKGKRCQILIISVPFESGRLPGAVIGGDESSLGWKGAWPGGA